MTARPRVLIADDHAAVARALTRLLSFECDVVGIVGDGNEVADAAARLQPVVVVLDLNLPNVNGLEICREITRKHPRAPVILMTAMIDDTIMKAALSAGASSSFDKSAMGDDLALAIKQAWAQSIITDHSS
jgi:DNA-binding NarL/FixJ family response regulator